MEVSVEVLQLMYFQMVKEMELGKKCNQGLGVKFEELKASPYDATYKRN